MNQAKMPYFVIIKLLIVYIDSMITHKIRPILDLYGLYDII